MRIKSLAQGENILTLGFEPSTFCIQNRHSNHYTVFPAQYSRYRIIRTILLIPFFQHSITGTVLSNPHCWYHYLTQYYHNHIADTVIPAQYNRHRIISTILLIPVFQHSIAGTVWSAPYWYCRQYVSIPILSAFCCHNGIAGTVSVLPTLYYHHCDVSTVLMGVCHMGNSGNISSTVLIVIRKQTQSYIPENHSWI